MSLASQQKQVIHDLASRFPTPTIVDVLRSLGDDFEPSDYRGALVDQAAHRLDTLDRMGKLLTMTGTDISEPTEEDIRRDAILNTAPKIDDYVACPADGCEQCNVHLTRVLINSGGNITRISRSGTKQYQAEALGRGVLVAIEYECEDGHTFVTRMHFHKGSTYCDKIVTESNDEGMTKTVIWRD